MISELPEGPDDKRPPDAPKAIVLPMDADEFATFMSGLLGSPQTIRKRLGGTFDLDSTIVTDLFFLLNQRMAQQNDARLLSFSVNVVYNDGTSILHNKLESFQRYNEIRRVYAVALVLEWKYLVKFNNKVIPEVQEVSVRFDTSPSAFRYLTMDRSISELRRYIACGVSFEISHTDWTWGADIEGRLAEFLKNKFKGEPAHRKWLRSHSSHISLAIVGLTILCSIGTVFWAMRWFADEQASALTPVIAEGTEVKDEMVEQLGLVQDALAQGAWFQFSLSSILFLATGSIVAVLFGFWVDNSLVAGPPSFLQLTPHSTQHRDETLLANEKSWKRFWISVVGSIVLGICGNIGFAVIVAYWYGIQSQ